MPQGLMRSPSTVELRNPSETSRAVLRSLPSPLKSAIKSDHEDRSTPEFGHDLWLTAVRVADGVPVADLRAGLLILERACETADEADIPHWLAKLRAKTAKRDGDVMDMAMTVVAYTEELAPYPADAVEWVLREWPRQSGPLAKWWPTWSELQGDLNVLCRERMLTLVAVRDALARAP